MAWSLPGAAQEFDAAAEAETGGSTVELRELERPEVRRIRFDHLRDRPFSNAKLRAAMRTRVGEAFERRFFRGDVAAIENLYRGAGYMSVDITGRTFRLDRDAKLEIQLDIDSGERWYVESAGVELLEGDYDIEALRGELRTREKEPFLYGDVLADERRLLTMLNNQGYAHARVGNLLQLDSDHHRASVVYKVQTGRRMYFGPIELIPRSATPGAALHTRPGLIRRSLTFAEGELYNPDDLSRTRSRLSRTDLFRSVTLNTPSVAPGDSVQPVQVLLQERKYIHLEANVFLNNAEPGVSANIQHGNWLGRGTRLGLDASAGQPLQGATVYLTERNVLSTGSDVTVSAGITDEWSSRLVYANPDDSLQFALLTANFSLLNELLLGFGEETAALIMEAFQYDYPSVERLMEFSGSLDRRWERSRREVYELTLSTTWRDARNQPEAGRRISLSRLDLSGASGADGLDTTGAFPGDVFTDNPFGEDPFLDDPLPDGDLFAGDGLTAYPYDGGKISIDETWLEILTDRSRTLNFSLALQRDTRDSPISARRGTLARAAALYAIQFGGQATRVLQGDGELRHYLPLGSHLVWAQAGRVLATGSLRRDRALPQSYWQFLGGEGSVRGVRRDGIRTVGGGRVSANVRNEVRAHSGAFGAVLFWDRGGVWRRGGDATWASMVDGYGVGLRYDMGIPFRLDAGWSNGYRDRYIYFSIGQAF